MGSQPEMLLEELAKAAPQKLVEAQEAKPRQAAEPVEPLQSEELSQTFLAEALEPLLSEAALLAPDLLVAPLTSPELGARALLAQELVEQAPAPELARQGLAGFLEPGALGQELVACLILG